MTDHYSSTPPRELMEQWASEKCYDERDWLYEFHIAARAAQWGSDQELEACCEYLARCAQWEPEDVAELRSARRPKPPSLKEQAIAVLEDAELDAAHYNILLRALEALPDD